MQIDLKISLLTFNHSLRTLENVLDNERKRYTFNIFVFFDGLWRFSIEKVSEDEICNPLGIYGH